jgi:hypothetical protein
MTLSSYGLPALCAAGSYGYAWLCVYPISPETIIDQLSNLPHFVSGCSKLLTHVITKLPSQLEIAEKRPYVQSSPISQTIITVLKPSCAQVAPLRLIVDQSIPLFVGVGLGLKAYLIIDLTKRFITTSSLSDRFMFVCMIFTHIKLAHECFSLMKPKQVIDVPSKEIPNQSPEVDDQKAILFTLVLKVIALVIQIRYRPFPTLGGALLGGSNFATKAKDSYPIFRTNLINKIKALGINLSDFGVSSSDDKLPSQAAAPTEKKMQVWDEWCNMACGITRPNVASQEGFKTGYMLATYVRTHLLSPKQIVPPAE